MMSYEKVFRQKYMYRNKANSKSYGTTMKYELLVAINADPRLTLIIITMLIKSNIPVTYVIR